MQSSEMVSSEMQRQEKRLSLRMYRCSLRKYQKRMSPSVKYPPRTPPPEEEEEEEEEALCPDTDDGY